MPMPHEAGSSDDDTPPTPWPSTLLHGVFDEIPRQQLPGVRPVHSPFQVPGSDGHPFWVPSPARRVRRVADQRRLRGDRRTAGAGVVVLRRPDHRLDHLLVVDIVLVAGAAIAIAVAWANATDGDYADAPDRQRPARNSETSSSPPARWVYDAAHQGWNELHAGYSIQLITNQLPRHPTPTEFNTWSSQLVRHDRERAAVHAARHETDRHDARPDQYLHQPARPQQPVDLPSRRRRMCSRRPASSDQMNRDAR